MESFTPKREAQELFSDAQEAVLEQRDNKFYDLISSLPEDMKNEWRLRFEAKDADCDEVLLKLTNFLVLREKTLKGRAEILEGASESTEVQVNEFLKLIDTAYENPKFFLGSGRTAKVYSVPQASKVCIKYVVSLSPLDIPVESEVDILNKLNNFVVEGIRTPTVYFKQVGYGRKQFYGMERIDGRDLGQILEDPDKNAELVYIASQMDREVVMQRLTAYFTEMFKVHKITHGDIRQVNLMLDKNGELYVIDFGKGKTEELGEDNEKKFLSDLASLKREVDAFFTSLDRLNKK